MDNLEEIRKVRIQKLENFKKAGMNPFTANVSFTHTNAEAIDGFKKLAGKPDKNGVVQKGKEITLVGRVRSLRGHGGSTFCHIEDGSTTLTASGKIQLYFKKDLIGDANYDLFVNNIDLGDFIEVKGKLFLTQKGEQTIQVLSWKILTKALMPIPSEWYGLEDVEERFRKRYLDILTNPETKKMFVRKSKFWQTMRSFLIEKGFMEVETPALENTTGGAEARPFITHHNALDLDVYLRISDELWLKRLIVAGYSKVFEIGRIFRNEGMDVEHLQDYTQMEFYWAYADYNDGMKLIEEMYKKIAQEVYGKTKFEIKGFNIDFAKKWETYDYVETIKKMTGIDVLNSDLKIIENKLNELKIDYDKRGFNITRAIDGLWKYCRKDITGPGFLINVPVTMEPLAKRMEKDNNLVERFQVILAGSEMGKGFSELNDPIDQLSRFDDQQKLREGGDEEAQMTDNDFVEALEYGMPPTCGFGVSERLFAFLENKPVRETVIFPLMRPRNK